MFYSIRHSTSEQNLKYTYSYLFLQGMMFSSGRALCILAVGETVIYIGTQSGQLCVLDVTNKPRLVHCMPALEDAILSMAYYPR